MSLLPTCASNPSLGAAGVICGVVVVVLIAVDAQDTRKAFALDDVGDSDGGVRASMVRDQAEDEVAKRGMALLSSEGGAAMLV